MSANNPSRVIVIGGSLAGLIVGNLLHRRGWDVHVFERARGELEGRGAGITILPGLVEGFQAAGVQETEESFGILLPERIALNCAGEIVAQRDFAQVMTSWARLYESLKAVFPVERYHSGMTLDRIEQNPDKVTARFSNGEQIDAQLLIGADGLRSTVRAQMLPDLKWHYPGYIAWRCLADENALSPAIREQLFGRYTVCVAPGEQAIAYAVPGPGHSIAPGERQYNVVWYHPYTEADLVPLMTDDSGRYHANGIPPALVRRQVRDEMVSMAQQALAPQFGEAIRQARLMFFQPIVDLESPHMAFGRVAVIGDAAFVARPHVAMGVPKAAADALALVESIDRGKDDLLSGLAEFEVERMRISTTIVNRGKYLGAYMGAQLKPEAERRRAEEQRIPEQVMMETAAPIVYR